MFQLKYKLVDPEQRFLKSQFFDLEILVCERDRDRDGMGAGRGREGERQRTFSFFFLFG